MCGIAGTVGGAPPDRGLLARMARAMAHRGPDGEGVWEDEVAGLAFRRLAIIDLDPRSDQPLHLGPWHLVMNGEIYDYRERRAELERLGHVFVTEGDGEVLLHAWAEWGEHALERINGMFAFAIWHDERRELTLCADPFGEKPVFWSRDGDRLVFASDIRALREAVPSIGPPAAGALGPFVALGLMPPVDSSFFAGVQRLPGAHLLRCAGGRIDVRRYWTPQPVDVPARYPDAVARLRELLVDSIRLRLRSDVPVGTSLSGGVDSSAVVALAGSLASGATRHAFTASFPGYERDEWKYAEHVAASAGVVEHHRVVPEPDALLDDLGTLVRDQEEPFGSLSIYAQWRVFKAAHEAGVTVLLDGQGGDELFAGYPGIAGWALRARGARPVARALVTGGPQRGDVLRALGSDMLPRAAARRHRRGLASAYAAADVVDAAVRLEPPVAAGGEGGSPLRRELLRQSFHTSLPQLLRYADRDSMAHSREVRLPLLDRRIAEFALSAPPEYLVGGGVTKRILRDAVRDVVPPEILARRDKVGFEPPQARWLETAAAIELAVDVLLDPASRATGLYDASAVEADAAGGRLARSGGTLARAERRALAGRARTRLRSVLTPVPVRRIVVVTYYFPPATAIGAHRWASMAQHLSAIGHDVTVVTSTIHGRLPDDGGRVVRTGDLGNAQALRRLLRRPRLPEPGAVAAQTPAPAVLTDLVPPDSHVMSWAPTALAAVLRLARRGQHRLPDHERPARLGASGRAPARRAPPAVAGRLPRRLALRAAARRLADAWPGAPRRLARAARRTAPPTWSSGRRPRSRRTSPPAWAPTRTGCPTASTQPRRIRAPPPAGEPGWLTLVHTGTLSGPRGRDPRPLLAALHAFNSRRPSGAPRVRLVLAGRPSVDDERLIAETAMTSAVRHVGLLDRGASLALQRGADALLLLTGNHRSEATGKLFEYLASGRPIIALAQGNEAERIVRETGTGVTVAGGDPEAIGAALGALADGSLERAYAPRELERFRYPGPAEAIAELVEEARARRPRRGRVPPS